MAQADIQRITYGGNLMIFVNSSPVAFSTSASLSISTEVRESSSKDSANWRDKSAGRFEWSCSTEGLYNMSTSGTTHSINDLYAYFTGGTAVAITFGSKTGTTPSWTLDSSIKYFSGQAVITGFEFTGADGETATYSISLEGNGELTLLG